MSCFETSGLDDEELKDRTYKVILGLEITIHFFYVLDIIMEISYKVKGDYQVFVNLETISKYIFEGILLGDMIWHYRVYPK